MTLLIALSFNIPSWGATLVAGLNIAFPVLALAVGFRAEMKETRERKEKEKLERQQQTASNDDESWRELTQDEEGTEKQDDGQEEDQEEEERYQDSRDERECNLELGRPTTADIQMVDAMDQELDTRLLRILVNSFLVLGFGAFVGAAVAIIGLLYSAASNSSVPSSYSYYQSSSAAGTSLSILDLEFAGYESWTQFTTNCCCQSRLAINPNGSLVNNTITSVTEEWKCKAKTGTKKYVYKLRTRRTNGEDGLGMRPYCSTQFNSAVVVGAPALNTATGKIEVQAATGVTLTKNQFTYLW